MKFSQVFTKFSHVTARGAGDASTFVGCLLLIAIWGLVGPFFNFSDTWQLAINTSTSIITFLMVFLIQNTQNRDGAAVQAKLDELIRASSAENRFIGIETLTQQEVDQFRQWCAAMASEGASASEADLQSMDHINDTVERVNAKADKAADAAV